MFWLFSYRVRFFPSLFSHGFYFKINLWICSSHIFREMLFTCKGPDWNKIILLSSCTNIRLLYSPSSICLSIKIWWFILHNNGLSYAQNYYKFSFCSIFFSNSAHIASTLQLYKMIFRAKNLFFICKSTHILYFKIYAKVHKTHSFFFQSFCHTRREILS